jgi:glutaredoxin
MTDQAQDIKIAQPRIVLYSREGCHLCEEAKVLLEQCGLQTVCVDIDDDTTLIKRFGTCVPVMEIDGRVRFRGRIEPVLLRRLVRRM